MWYGGPEGSTHCCCCWTKQTPSCFQGTVNSDGQCLSRSVILLCPLETLVLCFVFLPCPGALTLQATVVWSCRSEDWLKALALHVTAITPGWEGRGAEFGLPSCRYWMGLRHRSRVSQSGDDTGNERPPSIFMLHCRHVAVD